jgi:hypothetical protein
MVYSPYEDMEAFKTMFNPDYTEGESKKCLRLQEGDCFFANSWDNLLHFVVCEMVIEGGDRAHNEIFLTVFVKETFGNGRLRCDSHTFHFKCGFDETFFVLGGYFLYNTLSDTDRLFKECATPRTATHYRQKAK